MVYFRTTAKITTGSIDCLCHDTMERKRFNGHADAGPEGSQSRSVGIDRISSGDAERQTGMAGILEHQGARNGEGFGVPWKMERAVDAESDFRGRRDH